MPSDAQHCGTCRYLGGPVTRPDGSVLGDAACRRHPPQPYYDGRSIWWTHVPVRKTDWCGEWRLGEG